MKVIFTHQALRNLKKLDKKTQLRIITKLEFYSKQKDAFIFAEKLVDSNFGEWRFRIGDYRVLCDYKEKGIIVLKIGHRREIYK